MACAMDHSGSNGLTHLLQHAFESNWYGPGSTNMSPTEKRKGRTRTKKKPAKEIAVVDGNENEEEGEKGWANSLTSLYQVLPTHSHSNSANPSVNSHQPVTPRVWLCSRL